VIFRFEGYELDTDRFELRRDGASLHIEPLVFDLLHLLVRAGDRVVTKDEIVDGVWGGRIVSDSTISTAIKAARAVLGDDGQQQRLIRTAHGRGFRFVATASGTGDLLTPAPRETTKEADSTPTQADERPSIAVLRFRAAGEPHEHLGMAEALPYDLISALSRLRWLFVIARGSAFRFTSGETDIHEVGTLLGARYCLSGTIELFQSRIAVTVELAETRSAEVVWSDRLEGPLQDIHALRMKIATAVVTALEVYIPENEARFARLSMPEQLGTWSAYHLGLHHMYRFNAKDNALASTLFARCVAAEPTFARAHAGLSFTRFQDAFLNYGADREADVQAARRFAQQAIDLDPLDPFVNFTMGRSFWLEGDLEGSLPWLDRAVLISPNYAQGIYARGWAHTLAGRSGGGRDDVDQAMSLSPLDPLLYAMQCTRAFGLVSDGNFAEAAAWADRAARSPNAHVLIAMQAVVALELAGDTARAAAWAVNVKSRRPDASHAHFFQSFPFVDKDTRGLIGKALAAHGM
jgi:TolB-like protein